MHVQYMWYSADNDFCYNATCVHQNKCYFLKKNLMWCKKFYHHNSLTHNQVLWIWGDPHKYLMLGMRN